MQLNKIYNSLIPSNIQGNRNDNIQHKDQPYPSNSQQLNGKQKDDKL